MTADVALPLIVGLAGLGTLIYQIIAAFIRIKKEQDERYRRRTSSELYIFDESKSLDNEESLTTTRGR